MGCEMEEDMLNLNVWNQRCLEPYWELSEKGQVVNVRNRKKFEA